MTVIGGAFCGNELKVLGILSEPSIFINNIRTGHRDDHRRRWKRILNVEERISGRGFRRSRKPRRGKTGKGKGKKRQI